MSLFSQRELHLHLYARTPKRKKIFAKNRNNLFPKAIIDIDFFNVGEALCLGYGIKVVIKYPIR